MAMRSGFWRDFWALFKPYWFSEEKVIARLLLFTIVALTLAGVYMDVLFNDWYNLFYNTLQDKNRTEFFHQMVRFCVLAAIYIVIYRVRHLLQSDAPGPLAALAHGEVSDRMAWRTAPTTACSSTPAPPTTPISASPRT